MNPPDSMPMTGAAAATSNRIARLALLAAALLGGLADPLLRNGPWGLGLLVWMAAFAAIATALLRRSGRVRSRASGLWLTVAVLSAACPSWRDANMLQFFDVLAMLAALVLLAMSLNAIPVPGVAVACVRDLIRAAFGTGLEVATGAVPLFLRDAEFNAAVHPAAHGKVRRMGRAVAITLPILLVFALLLANADPIFGSLFRFPDIQFDVLVSHVAIAGFFA